MDYTKGVCNALANVVNVNYSYWSKMEVSANRKARACIHYFALALAANITMTIYHFISSFICDVFNFEAIGYNILMTCAGLGVTNALWKRHKVYKEKSKIRVGSKLVYMPDGKYYTLSEVNKLINICNRLEKLNERDLGVAICYISLMETLEKFEIKDIPRKPVITMIKQYIVCGKPILLSDGLAGAMKVLFPTLNDDELQKASLETFHYIRKNYMGLTVEQIEQTNQK